MARQQCEFDGCTKLRRVFGLCMGHAQQRQAGRALAPLRKYRTAGAGCVRDERGHKECASCLEWLAPDQFGPASKSKDGLRVWCRRCVRAHMFQSRYGITIDDFDRMLADQANSCAICRTPEPGKRAWHIDHDHDCCPTRGTSCGSCIRGILCHSCNTGLGLFRDDPARLGSAIKYLENRRKVAI